VAIVSDGSTPTQRTVRTTLAELPATLATADVRPPSVWVVGEVVSLAPGLGADPAEAADAPR
jgi:uroporphyrin-III C-methyltransferase/precorrin-2 dehydrogenase/sirohydrochlorin ferrochelatase